MQRLETRKKILGYVFLALLISTIFIPFIGLNFRVAEGSGSEAFRYYRLSPFNFLFNGGLGTGMSLAYIVPIVVLVILGFVQFKYNKLIHLIVSILLIVEWIIIFYVTILNAFDYLNIILSILVLLIVVINIGYKFLVKQDV